MNCQILSELLLFKQGLLLWQATFQWFYSRVLSLKGTLQKNSLFFPLLANMYVQLSYETSHVFVPSLGTENIFSFYFQVQRTYHRVGLFFFFHKIYRCMFPIRNYFGSRYSLCISYATFHLVIQFDRCDEAEISHTTICGNI